MGENSDRSYKKSARIAPNKPKVDNRPKAAEVSSRSAASPAVAAPSVAEIPRRFDRNAREFYKGEKNLKNLDSPAIHRRTLKIRNINEDNEEQPAETPGFGLKKAVGNRNILLNNRSEKIDKSDSEQPAFLRKIMD